MNKKLILYIGGFELPDKNAAAQRVLCNAKALNNLGFDTLFVGLSKGKDIGKKIEKFEGFEYINLQYPDNLKQWLSYLTSIKQYIPFLSIKKPEMIIAYNFPAIALNELHKWSSKVKIPLIADCTEWYEANGNLLFRLIKSFDTYLRMKKIHPKLDGIITISNYLFSYYSSKMKNVIKVPPLVDVNMDKWKLANNYQDSGESVDIIYAGSPGAGNKDRIDILLKILSQIKDEGFSKFKFTVIGITEQQYNISFAKELPFNIRENVVFKGRMSHIDTLDEIKKAHFNIFIRDNNLANNAGFPTKLAESISCGTPVLTNATSNIQDYLKIEENGFLLDTTSEKSIQKGIKDAVTLPLDKIQKMKEYCYQSKTFNYTNYTAHFALLIEKLKKN